MINKIQLLLIQNVKSVLNKKHYATASGLNLWNNEISCSIKHKIEDHWKDKINHTKFDESAPNTDKYYVLSMFPYPSGNLHMGHVRVYTISDAIARFQRMNGKNVIHPIGWDAFGLPAENAAIDRNIAPSKWTKDNCSNMKNQLKELGCSFDWFREIATCDPEYYQWTQELFLKLHDEGLAYQKEALVNWDPVDQTVLADEQVDENGCSWRSGAKVEKKLLKQWFIKTTKFAKNLLDGLDDSTLQDWRDIVKLQKHWIGECNGVSFDFKISGTDSSISLWTSTPEYIEHVKFMAVHESHLLAKQNNSEGGTTVKLIEKAENPLTGEKIPIFVTNEINYDLFTNSYVGIPGVSQEATDFAIQHKIDYSPVKRLSEKQIKLKQNEVCKKAQLLEKGGYWTSAKLRDWLISRQRYWGTPIPIIHCKNCGAQPVLRKDLPVVLPELDNISKKGVSPLKNCIEWLNTSCPKCNGPAERETDTMDTFVDSSWYYLRYLDPQNRKEMFNATKIKQMTPVDLYIGGKEHAVLHLYYARFISHFLHSLGLVPEREPFKRLLVQGMVMGRSYRIKGTGKYVSPTEVKILDSKRNKAIIESTGEPIVMSWEKMSKSKLNGVDPNDMFKEYGTDTTRLLILADVAPTSHRNWNRNTFPGIINWQKRLWLTIQDLLKHRNNPPPAISDDEFKAHDDYMFDSRNYYVKGATFNYCISQQLSIAVSKQQGLTNSIRRAPGAVFANSLQFERAVAAQIILLAPMAPHFASELWTGFLMAPNRLNQTAEIQWDKSVLEQKWPETDDHYNLDIVCQVNGNEQCVIKMTKQELAKLSKNEAIEMALKQKELQTFLQKANVVDSVYTFYPGLEATVNFITSSPNRTQLEVSESSDSS